MKIVELAAFEAVGIAARTDNEREATGKGAIPELWARVIRDGILAGIPNRADDDVLAIYSDYETDERGAYSFALCAKVFSPAELPDGMVLRRVPAGRYAVFTSERGPAAQVVPAAWARIWQLPKTGENVRSFRMDFERYGADARDPANSQVEVYVGLR